MKLPSNHYPTNFIYIISFIVEGYTKGYIEKIYTKGRYVYQERKKVS